MNSTITRLESEVRSYCRSFPTVFDRALGSELFDDSGKRYLDFFAGAGTLNYGHNHPAMRERMIEYLTSEGVTHGLDMATRAKISLLETFERTILAPRKLDYKLMFPGPTGTNSVEAALKLARKVTGRQQVISFTNAFHGMTLGSLAATGNQRKRCGAGVSLCHVTRMPFDGFLGESIDTIDVLEAFLNDPSSGVDAPAAFLVETVQGEGGINVASAEWLRRLETVARKHDVLLIVDDIQVGCGRTGAFFSFEEIGITPDIVCLSKSLSGFGLPFALTLFRPEFDVWSPGEHNGTFRGNNLAFVTAEVTLETFWADDTFRRSTDAKAELVAGRLDALAQRFDGEARGRGMIRGLAFEDHALADAISAAAFERGLIIETSGAYGEVVKFLAPLTTTEAQLNEGLDLLGEAIEAARETLAAHAKKTSETTTEGVHA